MAKPSASKSVFFYFAYGSNLLAERIHANNPSAIRKGIGPFGQAANPTNLRRFTGKGVKLMFGFGEVSQLAATEFASPNGPNIVPNILKFNTDSKKIQEYRLDFGFQSKRWNGSVATIVPDPDSHVWGAIWEINVADIPNLDRQEGVDNRIYEVVYVNPETPDKETVTCRCYQLCNIPPKIIDGEVPENRKPSLLYLSIILRGAEQSQVPQYYIEQLKKIQHNGWDDHSNIGTRRFMLEDD